MSQIKFVVVEDADGNAPLEVFAGNTRWQALEYKALNYVDEDVDKFGVAIAKKLSDGSYVIDI